MLMFRSQKDLSIRYVIEEALLHIVFTCALKERSLGIKIPRSINLFIPEVTIHREIDIVKWEDIHMQLAASSIAWNSAIKGNPFNLILWVMKRSDPFVINVEGEHKKGR